MRGRRGSTGWLPILRDSLRDLEVTVERMSVVNDHILTWCRIRGVNHAGIPALGIPGNGRRLDVPCVTVDGLADDDTPERWAAIDVAEVYRQLAPAPSGRTAES